MGLKHRQDRRAKPLNLFDFSPRNPSGCACPQLWDWRTVQRSQLTELLAVVGQILQPQRRSSQPRSMRALHFSLGQRVEPLDQPGMLVLPGQVQLGKRQRPPQVAVGEQMGAERRQRWLYLRRMVCRPHVNHVAHS